eukprot:6837477-Lingulodinium_polyedra.AAC.1
MTPSAPSRAFACASGASECCASLPVFGKTVQLLRISDFVATVFGMPFDVSSSTVQVLPAPRPVKGSTLLSS